MTTNGGINWSTQIHGYQFYSIFFPDPLTGWVAGIAGISYTNNGGINWNAIIQNQLWDNNSINFVNVNTGITVGRFGSTHYTINGGLNWSRTTFGWTNLIYKVQYIDNNTGWAAGQGGVLRTTNSGISWDTSMNNKTFYGMHFVNSYTGWVAGYTSNPLIYKTTNGGLNWQQQFIGGSNVLKSIYFANADTGCVVGDNGFIANTMNGGLDWQIQISGTTNYLESVKFINTKTGWAAGGGSNAVIKTTNSGYNWFPLTSVPFGTYRDIFFVNANTGGIISGTNFYKTTNGGSNWITYSTGSTSGFFGMHFINENSGWLVGEYGTIFSTTNSGVNWSGHQSLTNNILQSVYFINNSTGWAVGWEGVILKTTNGGIVTNFKNEINIKPETFYLHQNYPNPFNPSTNIKFDVARVGDVKIIVYDVMGREVQTLVNDKLQPGTYEATMDGSGLSSGIYFCRISADDFMKVIKLSLVK